MTRREYIDAQIKHEITKDAVAMLMPTVRKRLAEMPGEVVLAWYKSVGGLINARVAELEGYQAAAAKAAAEVGEEAQ